MKCLLGRTSIVKDVNMKCSRRVSYFIHLWVRRKEPFKQTCSTIPRLAAVLALMAPMVSCTGDGPLAPKPTSVRPSFEQWQPTQDVLFIATYLMDMGCEEMANMVYFAELNSEVEIVDRIVPNWYDHV